MGKPILLMHPKPLGLSSINLRVLGLRVLLALSSSKSLSLWLRLELNLFSILPLLLIRGRRSLTYFVAQTLGRVLIVYGLRIASLADGVWLGFLIKLGLAPYFSWYIEVLSLLTGVMF